MELPGYLKKLSMDTCELYKKIVKFGMYLKMYRYRSYKIFVASIHFAKTVKVFKRSIINYIRKLRYLMRSSLALIVYLKPLFLLYAKLLSACLQ